jgi:hypothetical protein
MTSRSVLLAVIVALCVGCSATNDPDGPARSGSASSSGQAATTTTSLAATTTTTTPEDAVKAAYLAYWAMVDRLLAAPDPEDPELAARMSEPALSDFVSDLQTRRLTGRLTQVPSAALNRHEVLSTIADHDQAMLYDCFVDGRIGFDADGSVINNDVVSKRLGATLRRFDTSWRVTSVATITKLPGSVPCADA